MEPSLETPSFLNASAKRAVEPQTENTTSCGCAFKRQSIAANNDCSVLRAPIKVAVAPSAASIRRPPYG